MASKWSTPFLKQLSVTAGVALGIGQFSFVAGFVVAIIPQLKRTDSPIPMDDDGASWFASMQALSLFIGYLVVAKIISNYGRAVGSIIGSGVILTGWTFILFAENLACLLIGRLFQGLGLGITLCVGPIVIAECTSPRHRGLLLASTTACMSANTAIIHYLGSCLHWRTSALFCTVIAFIDLLIVLHSPETPSWLASKGRYDECKEVYRWLRGANEEEELLEMIQVNANKEPTVKQKCDSVADYFKNIKMYILSMMKRKDAYKSIIIGVHLLIICYWSGLGIFASYPIELVQAVVGKDANTTSIILSLDIMRFLTGLLSMYVIKRFKRRTMLFSMGGLNVACSLVTAGIVYAKKYGIINFDVSYINIAILLVQVATIAMGTLPLPNIICAEIYPMEYRSIGIAITRLSSCIHIFGVYKTFPEILRRLNIYGGCCIFGGLCLYALIVCYFMMPETKDRTLQDIEDEMRGNAAKRGNTGESLL